MLSLRKNVENVFLSFFLKTLLHQKRLENVGLYPPDSAKNTKKNVQKTFGKRMKNVGVEQPCWEACGWRADMGDMSSQQVACEYGRVQCVQLKTIMNQGLGRHLWLLWSCPL